MNIDENGYVRLNFEELKTCVKEKYGKKKFMITVPIPKEDQIKSVNLHTVVISF
jgi:hypothetical protein